MCKNSNNLVFQQFPYNHIHFQHLIISATKLSILTSYRGYLYGKGIESIIHLYYISKVKQMKL